MLIASGMTDHAEAIISVVDVGPSLNQRLRRTLCIVKFAGIDQGDHRIGCVIDRGVAVVAEVRVMVRQMVCRLGGGNGSGLLSRGTVGRFILGEAALLVLLAAAARAAIIASDFRHFLNLTGRTDGVVPSPVGGCQVSSTAAGIRP